MYQYVIFGAGAQGEAAAWWLLRQADTEQITLVDVNPDKLRRAAIRLKEQPSRLRTVALNLLAEGTDLRQVMAGCRVAIGATSYAHYPALTEAAISAGCGWVDFGGKIAVRREQESLHQAAVAAGVAIAPDQGIAPGSVSVIAAKALADLGGRADYLWMRVGGIPVQDVPPLGYAWVFSADGLIQEMEAEAEVLLDGELKTIPSLTGLPMGHMDFSAPFGRLWHVPTSDGSGTFYETHRDKIKNGAYCTLRRTPEHWHFMIAMRDLGFWKKETVNVPNQGPVSPRAVTVSLLDNNLPRGVPDALVLGIEAGQGNQELRCEMIVYADSPAEVAAGAPGHSAMQKATAYSGAIAAWLIARGEVAAKGVIRLERDFPIDRFLQLMDASGLKLTAS